MSNTTFFKELYKAFQAGHYTDLKIICCSTELKVHKVILCSQSKVFHAMCSGNFAEASTNTVNLTEDGLDLVSRLVDSLYLGTYDDFKTEEDAEHWKSAHELHAAMFALGDKYDCTVLRETALAKFKEYTAKDDTQSVLGLIASVPFVYSSTPDSERTLREVIANRIRPKAARFIQKDVSWPFSKMMLANPKLGGDVHRWGKPCLQLLCCGLVPALRAPRQTITRRRKIIGS